MQVEYIFIYTHIYAFTPLCNLWRTSNWMTQAQIDVVRILSNNLLCLIHIILLKLKKKMKAY